MKLTFDGKQYEKTSFEGCIEKKEEPQSMVWLYILIACVVIVVIVVVVTIIIISKRKDRKELPK